MKKHKHDFRIYFFDKNYSALSFMKLYVFLNSRREHSKICYTIGKVPDKHNGFKYVLYNEYNETFKTTSNIVSKKDIQPLGNGFIKLTYGDYYVELSPNLRIMFIGRTCDRVKIKFHVDQPYFAYQPIKKNEIILRSILNIIKYDKLKNGCFNNFMEDYAECVYGLNHNRSIVADASLIKGFISPSIKRSFDYSRDIEYNRLILKICLHICKFINNKFNFKRFSVGPLTILIRYKFICISLFKTYIKVDKEKCKGSYNPGNCITDINQLPDSVINLICYLINNYPGSISTRKAISKIVMNKK